MKKQIMNISRQTYEEYFLLYNDGELTQEEKNAVDEFVRQNPDLESELILLRETVFTPDETITFDDKESLFRHERRVVPFPWFRLAAAAVLLVTFTLFGWLYIDEKKEVQKQTTVASRELIREDEKAPLGGLQKEEPALSPAGEQVALPSEKIDVDVNERSISAVLTASNAGKPSSRRVNAITQTAGSVRADEPETTPDHADVEHEIVRSVPGREVVDVAVYAQDIAEAPTAPAVHQPVVEYVEKEDEMIYFANTSLPKKSKLRGVFRKATRILDKVTSLQ